MYYYMNCQKRNASLWIFITQKIRFILSISYITWVSRSSGKISFSQLHFYSNCFQSQDRSLPVSLFSKTRKHSVYARDDSRLFEGVVSFNDDERKWDTSICRVGYLSPLVRPHSDRISSNARKNCGDERFQWASSTTSSLIDPALRDSTVIIHCHR